MVATRAATGKLLSTPHTSPIAGLPPLSANRTPLVPSLQTPHRPTYTRPLPPKVNNPASRGPRSSRENPFAKYAYLQKEHNWSPLEYKSPYIPGGGFMNGYQGSLEKHLLQMLKNNKPVPDYKPPPSSYGSKPAYSIAPPTAGSKKLSSTTSLSPSLHEQARVDKSSTYDHYHQANYQESSTIIERMMKNLKEASVFEKRVELLGSESKEKEAHLKTLRKRARVQETKRARPKSVAQAKATGRTAKLVGESSHWSGESRENGATEISDRDLQTPRSPQSLVSEESWIDSGYGSLYGDKESLRGGSPLPVSPVPINVEAERGDWEQFLLAKNDSLLSGDMKHRWTADGMKEQQGVTIQVEGSHNQKFKRLQKRKIIEITEKDPDYHFTPTQCLLESCKKGYIFETFQSYKTHLKNVHSGKRYCKIPGCHHTGPFASKSDLNRHIMAKHSPTWNAAKRFKCERQGCVARVKAWMRKDKLLEHDRKYHMNIPCYICNYYLHDFGELVDHTNLDHGWTESEHKEVALLDQARVQLATTQNQVFGLTMSSGDTISRTAPATPPISQAVLPRSFMSCETTSIMDGQTRNADIITIVTDPREYTTCSDPPPKHHSGFKAEPWQATGTPPVKFISSRKKIWVETIALANDPSHLEFCKDASSLEGTILKFQSDNGTNGERPGLEGEKLNCTMDEASEGEITESGTSSSEDCLYDMLRSDMGRLSRKAQHTGADGVPSTNLETMRLIMIERIMGRFWSVYNKHFAPYITRCAGASPSSASDMQGDSRRTDEGSKVSAQSKKRSTKDDEDCDDRQDGNDERPRRPTKKPKPDIESMLRWACPFRKDNPAKYNLNSYHICALRPWETIARVKEHLYLKHMAPLHCRRCWQMFESAEQLNGHMNVSKADVCELVKGEPPEGVSEHQARALRPKTKRYPNQSDESRWNDIYRILFPNKPVPPTPHFEAPREQLLAEQRSASPNTQILNDYDSFVREEVPRLFLSEVEEQMTPSAFQNFDLESVFRTCLERAARSFRERAHQNQRLEAPRGSETMRQEGDGSGVTPNILARQLRDTGYSGLDFLDAVLQPPPPQTETQILDPSFEDGFRVSQLGPQPGPYAARSSDSGYVSGQICNCIAPCNCQSNSMVSQNPTETKPSSFQQLAATNRYASFAVPTSEAPLRQFNAATSLNRIPRQDRHQIDTRLSLQPDILHADFNPRNSPGDIDLWLLPQPPQSEEDFWFNNIARGLPGDGYLPLGSHPQQQTYPPQLAPNPNHIIENDRPSFVPLPPRFGNNSINPSSTQTNLPANDLSWLDDIEWNYTGA